MKTRGFFNLDQAIQYLGNSIIRVAGHPVLITRVDSGNRGKGNFKLTYVKLDDARGKEYSILSDADEVNMHPIEMGMLSLRPNNPWTNYAQYIERAPLRAMKVGVNRNSTFVYAVKTGSRGIGGDCIYSKEFCDMAKGSYLSLPEALKATEKQGCYPFSRRFAVDEKRDVYFKAFGTPVGKVDGGEVALLDEAMWLKEVLNEDLNGRQAN